VDVEEAIITEYDRFCTVTQHPIDVSEDDTVGRDVSTLASAASGGTAGKTMFGLLFLVENRPHFAIHVVFIGALIPSKRRCLPW